MTAPPSPRVLTTLIVSAALHALALAAAHRPVFELARPGAFEPIEIELLGTAAPQASIPQRPLVAAAKARAATGSESAPAEASGSDAGDGAPGAEAMVRARADVAALNNPKPAYPLAARRRGMQGRVLLAAHVRMDGVCAEVHLKQSSGYALLDESALEAVRHWRFLPAQRGGVAIDSWVEVPVNFRLES